MRGGCYRSRKSLSLRNTAGFEAEYQCRRNFCESRSMTSLPGFSRVCCLARKQPQTGEKGCYFGRDRGCKKLDGHFCPCCGMLRTCPKSTTRSRMLAISRRWTFPSAERRVYCTPVAPPTRFSPVMEQNQASPNSRTYVRTGTCYTSRLENFLATDSHVLGGIASVEHHL